MACSLVFDPDSNGRFSAIRAGSKGFGGTWSSIRSGVPISVFHAGLLLNVFVLKRAKSGHILFRNGQKGAKTDMDHCARPGKCDVCGVSGLVYLRCSSMGPFTFSYCEQCAQFGAEPYWFTVSTVAINGLWPDDVNEPDQSRVREILNYLHCPEDIFKRDVYRSYHYMPIQSNQ